MMVQAVYSHGWLLASHTTLRKREGAHGGASGKRSIHLPAARSHLASFDEALGWHGALDAILTPQGLCYSDVNPRLVEPGNAWRAGVDLVDVLRRVPLDDPPEPHGPGRVDVRAHELLLAVLAVAKHGRRAVLHDLFNAARHAGPFRDSDEELTPLAGGDWRAAILVSVAATNCALTPQGWRAILATVSPAQEA